MVARTVSLYRNSFSGLSKSVWLLSAVTFINRSGTMVIPFLSVYLTSQKGFSLSEAGMTMLFFGLGSLSGSFLGGYLTDKIGYYSVMFWSLFLGGFLFIFMAYVDSLWGIWAFVFILSTIADSFRPATMTAIGVYSRPENRTRSFSLMRMAINLGWSVGPAAGGLLIVAIGYKSLFWADGLTCIVAALFFRLMLKPKKKVKTSEDEEVHPVEKVKAPSPYKDRPYLAFLAMTTVGAFIFLQLISTLPVFYNQEMHLTEAEIGGLLALNGLLIVFLEMPMIFTMEKKLNGLDSIAWGVLIYGFSYVVLNLAPAGIFIAMVSMISLSFGEIFNMPFTNTYAMSRTTDANRGQYMGLFSMSYSVAHIVGPVIGFKIAENWGFDTLWYILGGLSVAVYFGFMLMKKFEQKPATVQAEIPQEAE